jgi:hypothetical protein
VVELIATDDGYSPEEDEMADKSAAEQIDAILMKAGDWRAEQLSQLRALIKKADPDVLEDVKWKKPSKPEGVPVWSHDGIVCIGEMLKNAVRLTFPKGAQIQDTKQLFNARLESKSVRAIDVHEGNAVNEAALRALIRKAVEANTK